MRSASLLILLLSSSSLALTVVHSSPLLQGSGVSIVRRAVASADMSNSPHVEPRLAIDPKNPQHLLIGAMLFRRDGGGDSECTPLVSFDAGATWRRGSLPKREGVTGGGDPWVVFDVSGTAFLSCLHGARTETGERTSGVGVYRSADGGISWSGPTMLPGRAYDRPVLVVGQARNSASSLLHVVASQGVRSDFGAHSGQGIRRWLQVSAGGWRRKCRSLETRASAERRCLTELFK